MTDIHPLRISNRELRIKTKSGDTLLLMDQIVAITTVVTNEPFIIPIPAFRKTIDVEMDLHMTNGTIFTTVEMSKGNANLIKAKWLDCVNPNRGLEGESDDGIEEET